MIKPVDAESKPLVLIVDDNPNNLKVLGGTLRKTNDYKLMVASSGPQALSFMELDKPDVVLLDILMPGMDGYEVCRRIKANPEYQKIPIIFITAKSDSESMVRGFENGGVDYITKPFIREILQARINVHLKIKALLDKMETMAVTDELTGVYNRRYAFQVLERQIALSIREKSGFIICYIDMDHLKAINDRFGHFEGDKVIKTVANSIAGMVRKSDYLFRMGGDEFMMIFPRARLEEAELLVARLREQLNKKHVHGLPIDFSYGFAGFSHEDLVGAEELINKADTEMYASKQKKQNQGKANRGHDD